MFDNMGLGLLFNQLWSMWTEIFHTNIHFIITYYHIEVNP